jgi:hypothetical protein
MAGWQLAFLTCAHVCNLYVKFPFSHLRCIPRCWLIDTSLTYNNFCLCCKQETVFLPLNFFSNFIRPDSRCNIFLIVYMCVLGRDTHCLHCHSYRSLSWTGQACCRRRQGKKAQRKEGRLTHKCTPYWSWRRQRKYGICNFQPRCSEIVKFVGSMQTQVLFQTKFIRPQYCTHLKCSCFYVSASDIVPPR